MKTFKKGDLLKCVSEDGHPLLELGKVYVAYEDSYTSVNGKNQCIHVKGVPYLLYTHRFERMNKFRVGDKVVCVDPSGGLDRGRQYVVKRVFESLDDYFVDVEDEFGETHHGFYQDRFELAPAQYKPYGAFPEAPFHIKPVEMCATVKSNIPEEPRFEDLLTKTELEIYNTLKDRGRVVEFDQHAFGFNKPAYTFGEDGFTICTIVFKTTENGFEQIVYLTGAAKFNVHDSTYDKETGKRIAFARAVDQTW